KIKTELSSEIGEAMSQGDLRENAGYTAAKERQAEILRRINELETKLKKAQLIETLNVNKSSARIGATVTLKDCAGQRETCYTLCGPDEADPSQGRISIHSPIAQGIMGKKEGQECVINLPKGEKVYTLVKVEYK
ncbi:MAG: transcription elongation factor GreA, partial [Elusimicrobia bacterium]|nr:transcription elongation factor GreA [Elusimicrobiota bacterium]